MKTLFALSLAVGAVLFATACTEPDRMFHSNPDIVEGNGIVVEESRPVGSFTRIDLQGIGGVYVQQGALEELRIRAEENLLEYLKTDVQAGELVIWKDDVTLRHTRPIEYHLTVVDLDRLALTGAGGINASGLTTGPLALELSGTGGIELVDLNAPSIDTDHTGVGDVTVSGSVQQQTVRLENVGNYDARQLASMTADVRISNIGSATVRVQDQLTVTIDGSGNVYYIGDPVVDSSIGGSGEVVKIEG